MEVVELFNPHKPLPLVEKFNFNVKHDGIVGSIIHFVTFHIVSCQFPYDFFLITIQTCFMFCSFYLKLRDKWFHSTQI